VVGSGSYIAGFPVSVGLLSAGLCGMAGMLPDIDSSSSRSFQECIYFAAGLCAVLLVERVRFFGFDHNIVILSGAIAFLFVRFVVGEMVKRLTVHRGMFHSVPAAILAGELIFCLSSGDFHERLLKSFAIFAGYMSHLILDEICSIDQTGKKIKFKQSFGTALKLYDSKHVLSAMILYLLVFFIGAGTIRNSDLINNGQTTDEQVSMEQTDKSKKNSLRKLIRYLVGFDNSRQKRMTQQPSLEQTESTTKNTQTQITATLPAQTQQTTPAQNRTTNNNTDTQIFSQYRQRYKKQKTTQPDNQTNFSRSDLYPSNIQTDILSTPNNILPTAPSVLIPQEKYSDLPVNNTDKNNLHDDKRDDNLITRSIEPEIESSRISEMVPLSNENRNSTPKRLIIPHHSNTPAPINPKF
jgi:membrane-bound metal-dependent hydrolase YbcI (DUF457 family)